SECLPPMPLKNSFPVSLPIPDLEPPPQGYCHLLPRGETQTDPQSPTTVQSRIRSAIEKSLFPLSCWSSVTRLHLHKLFCLFDWQNWPFFSISQHFRAPLGPPILLGRRTNQAATQCFAFMRGPRPLGEGSRRIVDPGSFDGAAIR